MKTIKNTLEIDIDEWSDPGDYPNNVAQSPLPSRKFIDSVSGEVWVMLTDDEVKEAVDLFNIGKEYKKVEDNPDISFNEWLEGCDIELPKEIAKCTWEAVIAGNFLMLSVETFEESDYIPEPNYPEREDW